MNSKFLKKCLKAGIKTCALVVFSLGLAANTGLVHADKDGGKTNDGGHGEQIMWLNHFDLLSGNIDELTTTFNSTSSGVGGGLTGLVIQSVTVGDVFLAGGGNKVVQMALDLPKETKITGVRVCYENTSNASFITQIRLAQVQNPPSSAMVKLDDGSLCQQHPCQTSYQSEKWTYFAVTARQYRKCS